RWAVHLQNDFRARLEWCVKPVKEANHPPRIVVNGVEGKDAIRLLPAADVPLKLDAAGSHDPDGDPLSYKWFVYPEAGTYSRPLRIDDAASPTATVHIPADAAGKEIHVILAVTDNGKPPLTRYRRAVIAPQDVAAAWRTIAPFCQPPPEFADKFGSYRSPLLFQNGSRVRSAADWPRRRQEILDTWHGLMGPWPAVL